MMYVLIIANGYPTIGNRGLGIFELDQAKALKAIGCKVVYAAIDVRSVRRRRKWGYEERTIDGVEIHAVNIPGGKIYPALLFSVTIIVRVLLRVFDRITGLNPVQVESSSSSIRGGKGEALPGGQRAAALHQDKASIPNTTHYDRSMVRRFCQRVQS